MQRRVESASPRRPVVSAAATPRRSSCSRSLGPKLRGMLAEQSKMNRPQSTPASARAGGTLPFMKPTVYIETSIISYLAARPSRDLMVAANQQATEEWWRTRREEFNLVVSTAVVDEIAQGDPAAAERRLHLVRGVSILRPSDADAALARRLVTGLRLPQRGAVDALHIAVAAMNDVRYLLTWNCTHIANAALRPGIESACREAGLTAPLICTPPQLM